MRKIVLVLVMLVCALMAQAGEYAYQVFTNTKSTHTALSVTNLTMTVNGAQLEVTNADSTVQFTLTDLAAMQFSTDGEELLNGIDIVLSEDAPVTVYAITGMVVGSFTGWWQAAQQLDRGMYVVVQNGKSQKLIVR